MTRSTPCNQHPDIGDECGCPMSIRTAVVIAKPSQRVVTVWDTSADVPLESPKWPGGDR